MNEVPNKTNFSFIRGYWFAFSDGNAEISAGGSAITGIEYIYVNGELVSEKRSLAKTSKHSFVIGDTNYEIVFHVINMLKSTMECSLLKNGEIVKKYKTLYKNKLYVF